MAIDFRNTREDATFNNMEFDKDKLLPGKVNFAQENTITEWIMVIRDWGERKGWNENLDIPSQFANFHAEISEAWEEYRHSRTMFEVYYNHDLCNCGLWPDNPGHVSTLALHAPGCAATKPEGIPIELADLVIRVLHTCGNYGIDLEEMIKLKMTYNETREFRHGGLRA